MSVNEFDSAKPATSGTDSSADLRNNFLSLSQGADLLNVYASTPNDKKVHWKAANRVYIGGAMLAIASGELNMANFNSYVATDGYWAKALLNINFSGEKDVRIGTQSQWSGETTMPNIPSSEIPIATVNFQRNGSSINNIANTNINDMRPMVMVDAMEGYRPSTAAIASRIVVSNTSGEINYTATNATNLTAGISSLIRDEQSAQNAGVITVAVGVTTIVDVASMNVINGDRILITGLCESTKGATAGSTLIEIMQASGTATILTYNGRTELRMNSYDQASEVAYRTLSGIIKVTGTGTLVLRMRGLSNGSDSSVAPSGGQFHALVLKGS